MSRPENVVASAEVPEQNNFTREKFQVRRRRLGAAAGGEKLGCSLVEVPPGKSSWPTHYHLANEEAVFVLEGEGVLWQGKAECAIRGGDYVALRIGPPGHRIENRSRTALRYLAISTMIEPEISVYPDSEKVGVLARKIAGLFDVYERKGAVDYWKGEE